MKVVKFGGSSCADSGQFAKVRSIIEKDPDRSVVVVSAPGKRSEKDHKITDVLYLTQRLASIGMGGGEVFDAIEERFREIHSGLKLQAKLDDQLAEIRQKIFLGMTEDYTASRGEYLSAFLMADCLGYEFVDAAEVIRFTEEGSLDEASTTRLIRERIMGRRVVVPGFYGAKENGEIVTFSRGGSDITGSILAAALDADIYENWTDVSGFLAADPRIVANPVPIRVVTYAELHELSYMGAQVLHEDAIAPVRRAGIPIRILNTNHMEEEGTLIVPSSGKNKRIVTGIAGKKGFDIVNVHKYHGAGDSGFFRRLCSVFEANDVKIEHLPTGIDSVSIIVQDEEFQGKEKKILEEVDIYCDPDTIDVEDSLSLLAIVGEGMLRHAGVSARVFQALAEARINVRMISQGSSELNIIVGVETGDFERAVKALYDAFFMKENAMNPSQEENARRER